MANTLTPGQRLAAGDALTSPSGRFALRMQTDGNLVLYDGTRATWSSRSSGTGRYGHADLQLDGNFVVYQGSSPKWATGTNGKSVAVLVLQDDGQVVLYADAARTRPLWASNTYNAQAAAASQAAAAAAAAAANGGKLPPGLDKLAYVGHRVGDLTPAAVEALRVQARRAHALQDPNTGAQKNADNFGSYWIAAAGTATTWNLSHDAGTRSSSLANILRAYDNPASPIVQVKVAMETTSGLVAVLEAVPAVATAMITAPVYVATAAVDGAAFVATGSGLGLTTDLAGYSLTHPLETSAAVAGGALLAAGGAALAGPALAAAGGISAGGAAAAVSAGVTIAKATGVLPSGSSSSSPATSSPPLAPVAMDPERWETFSEWTARVLG